MDFVRHNSTFVWGGAAWARGKRFRCFQGYTGGIWPPAMVSRSRASIAGSFIVTSVRIPGRQPLTVAGGTAIEAALVCAGVRLKLSCLDHIFETIDIEPVADRVEDADGLLSLEQFLNQLGDRGFAIAGLCEHL